MERDIQNYNTKEYNAITFFSSRSITSILVSTISDEVHNGDNN